MVPFGKSEGMGTRLQQWCCLLQWRNTRLLCAKATRSTGPALPPVVQHYTRRPSAPAIENLVPHSSNSGPDDLIAPSSDPAPSDDLPIALRKGYAGAKEDRRSTSGYCVFFGGNLISWKSKKQKVVSLSTAESEYRAMAKSAGEILSVYNFLSEVGLKVSMPTKLWCDNQAALHIASNSVFHERTKHIEIDCHFIREKIKNGLIATGYTKTKDQLGDLFTNALNGVRINYLCSKLGIINIYAPA